MGLVIVTILWSDCYVITIGGGFQVQFIIRQCIGLWRDRHLSWVHSWNRCDIICHNDEIYLFLLQIWFQVMDINLFTDFVMSHIFKYFTKFRMKRIFCLLSNRYFVDRVCYSRYRCYWYGMTQCPIYGVTWWYHDRTPWLKYMMLNIPTVFLNTFFERAHS